MASQDHDHLFPLPLTAFERFMLTDESDDYPMVFFMHVRLKGVVDRDLLRLALLDAIDRHPLMACRVEKNWRSVEWRKVEGELPEVDWDKAHWMDEKPWQKPIDLTTSIGLRAWGEQQEDHATITLQFHHACCDGIGAAQFLEDIATGYAWHYGMSTGQQTELPELRPLDLDLLKNRDSAEGRRVANLSGGIARRAQIILKYTLRYLNQKKLPLLAKAPGSGSDRESGLGIQNIKLDRKQTRGIRKAASRQNASLNDLLVRELMIASDSWNRRIEGNKRPRFSLRSPTLCVLVPTSLRGPSDLELPACNVVSYIFMARPVSLVAEPERLLHTIRDEMQLVHQFQAGWMFVQALETMRKIPGMLKLIMLRTRKSCMSTTVLSHMGNLLNGIGSRLPKVDGLIQMGNLQIDDVYGIPPIRQGTPAVFSTIMKSGCLSVSLRCCPNRFSQADAQELIDIFVARLKHTAQQNQQQKTVVAAQQSETSESKVQIEAH